MEKVRLSFAALFMHMVGLWLWGAVFMSLFGLFYQFSSVNRAAAAGLLYGLVFDAVRLFLGRRDEWKDLAPASAIGYLLAGGLGAAAGFANIVQVHDLLRNLAL